MNCNACRWWHKLNPVHDSTEWANCLALPYPTCVETMLHKDAPCIVPDKFQPKDDDAHST